MFHLFFGNVSSLARKTVSDTVVAGCEDDWRLLTDDSTFTNHKRPETAQVRLNGADTTPATAQVSVSDSLTTGLTDAFTGSQVIAVADSLAVQVSTLTSIASTLTAADTTAVQATEAATILNAFTGVDALSTGLTEGTPSLSAVLTATDSCAAQVSEAVSTLSASVLANDVLLAGLTDTFTGSQSLATTDSVTVGLTEAPGIAASVSATDVLVVGLQGTVAQLAAVLTAADSCAAQLTEPVNLVQNAVISATDSVTVRLSTAVDIALAQAATDVLEIRAVGTFTGSQALSVSDALSNVASEDQVSSLPTAASDEALIVLSDVASVGVSFTTIDDLITQLEEAGSQQDVEAAIPKAVQDRMAAQCEEGAVTEVAGPYWSGTNGDDYGLVYADSYQMGRRENPGRMRW
jgi:hypothetical protein